MTQQKGNTKNQSVVLASALIANIMQSTQQRISQKQIQNKISNHLTKMANYSIYEAVFPLAQNQQKSHKIKHQNNNQTIKHSEKGFVKDQHPSCILIDNMAVHTINKQKKSQIRLRSKFSQYSSKNSQKKATNLISSRFKGFNSQQNYSSIKTKYNQKKTYKITENEIDRIIPINFCEVQQTKFQSQKRKHISQNQKALKIECQSNRKKMQSFIIQSEKAKEVMKILQDKGKGLAYHYDGQILNKQMQQKFDSNLNNQKNQNIYQQKQDIKVIARQVKFQIKDKDRNELSQNSFASFDLTQFQQRQGVPKIFKKHSRMSKLNRYAVQGGQTIFLNNYQRQTSCIPYTEVSQGVKISQKTSNQMDLRIQKIKMVTQSREQYLNKVNQFSFRSYLPISSKSNSIILQKTSRFEQKQAILNFESNFKSQTLYIRPKTTANTRQKREHFKTVESNRKTQKNGINLKITSNKDKKCLTQRQFAFNNSNRVKSVLWNPSNYAKRQKGIMWKNQQLYRTLQF